MPVELPAGVVSAAGVDVVARSVTVKPSGPYAALLADGVTPTPASVVFAKNYDYGGAVYNVKAAGAKGDTQFVTDGVTASNNTLTSASGLFVAGDVGKLISIIDITTGTATLNRTITAFNSATSVTFSGAVAPSSLTGNLVLWGTNDTVAIQAAITKAQLVNGTVQVPAAAVGYMINAALIISASCTLWGDGAREIMQTVTASVAAKNIPTVPPYLTGSVFFQTASATDGIQITGIGLTVNKYGIGVNFTNRFQNTGHGHVVIPPVNGAKLDHGIWNSNWIGVKCYGHDGNHYGIKVVNGMMNQLSSCRTYGGGALSLTENGFEPYGNEQIDHFYGNVFVGGTAHGVEMACTFFQGITLTSFGRLQIWTADYSAGGVPGISPATAAQYRFKADQTNVTSVAFSGLLDLQTTVASPIQLPIIGTSVLAMGPLLQGNSAKIYGNGQGNTVPLQVYAQAAQAGNMFAVNYDSNDAHLAFWVDSAGVLHSIGGLAISTAGGAQTGPSIYSASSYLLLRGPAGGGVGLNPNNSTTTTLDANTDGTIRALKGKFYPATDANAAQTACGIFAGTGVPNNANGANGDIYFRSDGGAGTTIYQRRAGAWVATGA